MIDVFKVIVSGFVFNDKDQLLVIRRSPDEETFPNMLAIPGGTVEVEADSGLTNDTIEQNLIREVKEETGIDVSIGEWIESSALAKDKAKLYLFFKCYAEGDQVAKISDETPEAFWADVDTVDPTECTPSLKSFLESR